MAEREAIEERHGEELEELEEKCRAHIESVKANAGKGKKAKAAIEAAEREVEQWKYELNEHQSAELDELDAKEHVISEASSPSRTAPPADDDADDGASKKEKAQRKREARASKEAAREAQIERERREAGPSRRALELAALTMKLGKCSPPLRVLEIAADGHCLYRAVGDQIRRVRPDLHKWQRKPEFVHDEVRSLCAGALRKRADEYAPFAECKDGEDFLRGYCDRVETSGDWGGELELRALADELHCQILVHRAEEGDLALGNGGGAPLQVAFHQFYYALGAHYNSVVPADA